MTGYEELAKLTARFPELLIVRRFDRLSARILLAMQAELLHLEQELQTYVEEDEKNASTLGMSASWGKSQAIFNEGNARLQRGKFEDVQKKLQTYHETLLRTSQIQQLSMPSPQNRERLWDWLKSEEGGHDFLKGCEVSPWDFDENNSSMVRDLATISHGPDTLDSWLADTVVPKYHSWFGYRARASSDPELAAWNLREYRTQSLHRLGSFLCMLLSALGPVVSIQVLYWIPDTLGRLMAITGFIIVFAIIMVYVSGCRRFEVFGATAAFAAVQVVFLQGLTGAINCR